MKVFQIRQNFKSGPIHFGRSRICKKAGFQPEPKSGRALVLDMNMHYASSHSLSVSSVRSKTLIGFREIPPTPEHPT